MTHDNGAYDKYRDAEGRWPLLDSAVRAIYLHRNNGRWQPLATGSLVWCQIAVEFEAGLLAIGMHLAEPSE